MNMVQTWYMHGISTSIHARIIVWMWYTHHMKRGLNMVYRKYTWCKPGINGLRIGNWSIARIIIPSHFVNCNGISINSERGWGHMNKKHGVSKPYHQNIIGNNGWRKKIWKHVVVRGQSIRVPIQKQFQAWDPVSSVLEPYATSRFLRECF